LTEHANTRFDLAKSTMSSVSLAEVSEAAFPAIHKLADCDEQERVRWNVDEHRRDASRI